MKKGIPLQEWVETEVEPIKKRFTSKEIAEMYFFRDEIRPRIINPDFIYSPADGIIINQIIVKADEPLMEIKGKRYNLKKALMDPWFNGEGKDFMVIDIFLTYYNVHYTRVPYSGIITNEPLEMIHCNNYPMLAMENNILKGIINLNSADYLFRNERVLTTIYCPSLDQNIYLLNIADYDINNIIAYDEDGASVLMGGKMGQIRYGSQVSLIVPLSQCGIKYKFCQEVGVVVKGNVNPLIEIL